MNHHVFPKHSFIKNLLLVSFIPILSLYFFDISLSIILISCLVVLILDFVNEIIFYNITLPLEQLVIKSIIFDHSMALAIETSSQKSTSHNDIE